MKPRKISYAVPLLAGWGWDDRVLGPSTHPQRRCADLMQLQSRRWQTAIAIDQDFQELLQFISPSTANYSCHSPRVSALIIRVCMEVESCFKTILSMSGVADKHQRNIKDFRAVERSHTLSKFKVRFHGWHQRDTIFRPFESWSPDLLENDSRQAGLQWYSAYGSLKHNILKESEFGHFKNLCMSIAGLHALLVSQFGFVNWGPPSSVGFNSEREYECALGGVVEVRFPRKSECNIIYDLPRCWNYPIEGFDNY